MDKTFFIFLYEYKLGKQLLKQQETSMKHLVKDLFLFAQHKGGSKGFANVTKGFLSLSIQEGSDQSMTTISGKLWRHENDPYLKQIVTCDEK